MAKRVRKVKAKPVEEPVISTVIAAETPQPSTLQAILENAPPIPWKLKVTSDFRVKYLDLLRNLVELSGLPYHVNNEGYIQSREVT